MQIQDLQVVLKVAEFKSITLAATSLEMSAATASAAVKRVEKSLGIDLFIRSTRRLRLSVAGERYVSQCGQALNLLDLAKQNIQTDAESIEGEIRLSLSSDLGRNLVLPWLDEFIELYPKISLKVNISDSNVDFYRDSIDLALRYGFVQDAALYGFKICNVPGVLCASPNYLAHHQKPLHPQDLVSHNGLFYQLHDVTHNIWTFRKNQEEFKIKMSGNRASNDGDLVRRWCVAGKGVAVKSYLDMSQDLLNGQVVPIIPEFTSRMTELWLICPSKQTITPAVRLLRDMLQLKTKAVFKQLIDAGFMNPDFKIE
ncbi:LysR substrate-binding domain-containing protein [Catenovulum sp. 2E275]|uniref:LysR family transcriptional regulator n=1 Tax=Catenovulum sp. 2E275 TaxID=2980497 RepID=UPI0021D0434C|nr:LysR family transcriptional regulator [Catenovulum sp. 2E275]MCU4677087.1 LysR substrate-binding domain-containing protein [Catenovulum sp. 2E275]